VAGVRQKPPNRWPHAMAWHSYVVAQQPGTPFFTHHLRNAAVECMNRLGEHVSHGKTWAQAIELRQAELEAARGA
jgi:hypothetical protein